jgi:tyrosyl-tRNA synthetase
MYSKLEKTPDDLLQDYFELLTDVDLAELPENPRQAQKLLAIEVASQFHGKDAALQAQQTAEQIVLQGNTAGGDIAEYSLSSVEFPAKLFYILGASGLCKSSGEGRRQIQGGAVRLEGDRQSDVNLTFDSPDELVGKVLQVGKKKFIRLVS